MKNGFRIGTILMCAMALPASLQAQEDARALTLEMATQAIDAAEAEARRNDWNVTIVVTDAEGVPVYLRRLDGASARSYDVAMRKAATVAATGLTTATYGIRLEAGEVEAIPDGVTFAGGVPIELGGDLIGTVATSGVQAIQDEQVSQAGADAVGG